MRFVSLIMLFCLMTASCAAVNGSPADTPEIGKSHTYKSEHATSTVWGTVWGLLIFAYIPLGVGFFCGYNRWHGAGKLLYFSVFPIHWLVLFLAQIATREYVHPAETEKYAIFMVLHTILVVFALCLILLIGAAVIYSNPAS